MSNTNVQYGGGGIGLFSIAILLMIAGFAMETTDYEPELGALLFTIGFWLFVIPLIIVAVILVVIVIIGVASTR